MGRRKGTASGGGAEDCARECAFLHVGLCGGEKTRSYGQLRGAHVGAYSKSLWLVQ